MQRHLPKRRRHQSTGAFATMCRAILVATLSLVGLLGACGGGETVTGSQQPVRSVESVTLSLTSVTITVGQQRVIVATPRDAAGNPMAEATVAWTSSASTVATVDAGGTVTGVAAGTAVVTAAVGGKVASATVTVTPPTYDGRWIGTTSQGDTIAFTISGVTVLDETIRFRLTGDCAIGAITIHVVGPGGSRSGQQLTIMSGTDLSVTGTLSSFDAASGTGSYTLRGSAPVCTSTSSTTWTAHKS